MYIEHKKHLYGVKQELGAPIGQRLLISPTRPASNTDCGEWRHSDVGNGGRLSGIVCLRAKGRSRDSRPSGRNGRKSQYRGRNFGAGFPEQPRLPGFSTNV
jgi:hypothetical protein